MAEAEPAEPPSRHLLSGSLFLGGRYDSNANAGPATQRVRLFGFEGPFLDEEFTEEDDFSIVGTAEATYAYAVDEEGRTAIEANALAFAQRYFDVDEFNASLVELDLGPRLALGDAATPLSLRPFATGSYLALDDETYRATAGGGVDLIKVFSPRWLARATVLGQQEWFYDTDERRPRATRPARPSPGAPR